MKIRHAMTGFFASAHTSSTVGDALEKMLREGLGHLWIVDDKCQLVGSIREPMLLDAVYDNQWRDHCVTRHMDRQMVTVSPEERVDAVLEKISSPPFAPWLELSSPMGTSSSSTSFSAASRR